MKDLIAKLEKVQLYLENDLKDDVGIQAKNHFKKSFRDEGFTDNKLSKWKEVKRREGENLKGATSKRKILTGTTKQLQDSIDYNTTHDGVEIVTDVVYAQIHNEGGQAGRNGSATIPKRQFIGESENLNNKIASEIESEISKRMND
jgi:phage gpG-like protein